jgi:GNAT superfamily N-acetyltransferase
MNIQKGKYRHYKGNLYEVIDIARHSETLEDMVIYKALYHDFGIWVRPLKMFLEDVEVNGRIQKRFELLEEAIHIDALKSDYKLFESTSDEAEILNSKMDKFNAQQLSFIGDVEYEKNYLIKNKTGDIIAGIRGCFYLRECLYISLLFIDEDKRKQGLGSILLRTIEQEAKSVNIRLIHLNTFDFQAKDFYIKHGYEVFGILDDCPKGHKRYYMKKILGC